MQNYQVVCLKMAKMVKKKKTSKENQNIWYEADMGIYFVEKQQLGNAKQP